MVWLKNLELKSADYSWNRLKRWIEKSIQSCALLGIYDCLQTIAISRQWFKLCAWSWLAHDPVKSGWTSWQKFVQWKQDEKMPIIAWPNHSFSDCSEDKFRQRAWPFKACKQHCFVVDQHTFEFRESGNEVFWLKIMPKETPHASCLFWWMHLA